VVCKNKIEVNASSMPNLKDIKEEKLTSNVEGVKSIDVLLWADQVQHLLLAYVLWKRELHEYPADFLALLHLFDALHDLPLSNRLAQMIPQVLYAQ
jgi:hypothetical protein